MVRGVIVAGLEVVEAGFGIVDVASVAQGVAVDEADRGGGSSDGGIRGHVAPRVVGVVAVGLDGVAGDVAIGVLDRRAPEDHHHIAL